MGPGKRAQARAHRLCQFLGGAVRARAERHHAAREREQILDAMFHFPQQQFLLALRLLNVR